MTSHRTAAHALAGISALVLTVGFLSGCTPEPDPTPTPTAAFASEEEAFAAAEEVYRAYNEAADSATSNADEFLTGTALEEYLEGAQYLSANGLTLGGVTKVVSFVGKSADVSGEVARISAEACVDLSQSTVLDSSGANVTPTERADGWRFALTFIGDGNTLVIDTSSGAEDPSCVPVS